MSQQLETTSDVDLKAMSQGLPNFFVLPVDKLRGRKLKPKQACVVNLDKSTGPGTHWVGIYNAPNQKFVLYYDSFGVPPDTRIQSFIRTSHKPFISLTHHLQDIYASSCGYYVMHFLHELNNGKTLGQYLSQWSLNDQKANEATLRKYFQNK